MSSNIDNPRPVFDHREKKWTVEWSGGLRKPDLWFESEDAAARWCDKMIKIWER